MATDTYSLTGRLVDGSWSGVRRTSVRATLVDPGTGKTRRGWTADGIAVRHVEAQVDDDGTWELLLPANGDVTPGGSGWLIAADGKTLGIVEKAAVPEDWSEVAILEGDAPMTPAAMQSAIDRGLVVGPDAVAAVEQRIDGLGPGDVGADPAGTAASEAAGRVSKAGDTMTGDLIMDTAAIRDAYGALIEHTYTQTSAPTDLLAWSPVRIKVHGTISDSSSLGGPQWGKVDGDSFGLPGLVDLAGRIFIARDQGTYSMTGPGMSWTLRMGNNPGAARKFVPGWGFQAAPIYIADGAKVTAGPNDGNTGGAMFFDVQCWTTADGGELDGVANDAVMTTLLSMPQALGNSHIAGRVAVEIRDVTSDRGSGAHDVHGLPHEEALAFSEGYLGSVLVPGQDVVGGGTVDWQTGVEIRRLVGATTNIGIENASATVEVPLPVVVSSASSVIDDPVATNISATLLAVDNTSGGAVTLTSTPTIPAGEDGQRIHILNVSDDAITVQGDGVLAGSGVRTVGASRTIGAGEVSTWIYSADLAVWVEADQGSAVDAARQVADAALPASTAVGSLTPPTDMLLGGGVFPATVAGMRMPGDAYPRIGYAHGTFLGTGIAVGDGTTAPSDMLISVTPTGEANVSNRRIISVGAPVDHTDAATKASAAGSSPRTVTTSRDLEAADVGSPLLCTAAVTLTAKNFTTTGWPIGASTAVVQHGANPVTIAVSGGAVLHAPGGATSTGQGQEGILRRISVTDWSITWLGAPDAVRSTDYSDIVEVTESEWAGIDPGDPSVLYVVVPD